MQQKFPLTWVDELETSESENQINLDVLREKLRLKYLSNALFADGETEVIVAYSGGGDSGDVDENNTDDPEVADFLMHFVNNTHSGWENNDGGSGEIFWDLRSDTIKLEHSEYFTDSRDYKYEFPVGEFKTKVENI